MIATLKWLMTFLFNQNQVLWHGWTRELTESFSAELFQMGTTTCPKFMLTWKSKVWYTGSWERLNNAPSKHASKKSAWQVTNWMLTRRGVFIKTEESSKHQRSSVVKSQALAKKTVRVQTSGISANSVANCTILLALSIVWCANWH